MLGLWIYTLVSSTVSVGLKIGVESFVLDPFGGTKPGLAGRGKEALLRVNPQSLARSKAGESKG
jgi:hypothetical protein